MKILIKSLVYVIQLPVLIFFLILFKLKKLIKVARFSVDTLFFKLSNLTDYAFTFHLRPIKSAQVSTAKIFASEAFVNMDTCIVIQGPNVRNQNFTIETARLYRKNFPDIHIVFSTWNNLSEPEVREFEKIDVELILNDKPEVPGSHNVNFQIISTLTGIKNSDEKKCLYTMKTRSDQRFYSPSAINYMKALLKLFPVESSLDAKGRIIEPGITVCKYRYWSMCDMFQFGFTEDLLKMWDIPLDSRSRTQQEYSLSRYKVKDIIVENVAEIYIHRSFASTLNLDSSINAKAYYDFIKRACLIIDKESVDLFWFKYSSAEYDWAGHPAYSENQLLSRLSFSEWIMLFNGAKVDYPYCDVNLEIYEN